MEITTSKLVAVVVAIGVSAAAALLRRAVGAGVVTAVALLFPLSLIWFPESWGERTIGRISKATPAGVIAFGGWVLLVGLPVALYWLNTKPAV